MAVLIKTAKLNWEKHALYVGEHGARTPFGTTYEVGRLSGRKMFCAWYSQNGCDMYRIPSKKRYFHTVRGAKSAAQNHFDRLAIACLELGGR